MNLKQYRTLFHEVLANRVSQPPPMRPTATRSTPPPLHSCRHTFAGLMKRADGSGKDKPELIGHSSHERLRRYQAVSFEDLCKITGGIWAIAQ